MVLSRQANVAKRKWSEWPFLPVARYDDEGGSTEIGVLVAGCGADVYLTNIMGALTAWTRGGFRLSDQRFKKWRSQCPKQSYATVIAMYQDGWSPHPPDTGVK